MEMTDVPLEDIERDLLLWSGRIASAEAERLRLIGEFDAREGWAASGVLSCAQWLIWRTGMSGNAARERVRVARKLRELPGLATAFGAGQLSYSQVRAITRVASPGDEQTWLGLAMHTTAAQLEKAVRGVSKARMAERDAADPEATAWRLRDRVGWEDDGTLVLTLRFAPADAPLVLAALEPPRAQVQADRDAQLAKIAAVVAAAESGPADVSAETPEQPDAGEAGAAVPAAETGPAGVSAETPERPSPQAGGGSQAAKMAVPDVSAETPGTLTSAIPERYEYIEPPYPGLAYLGWLPSQLPADLNDRINTWRQEKEQLWAKAQAWQEHQAKVAAKAQEQGVLTCKATLADGLLRLLTHGAGSVKLELIIDPLSGWARTRKDELLPPSIVSDMLRQAGPPLPKIRPITADDLLRHDKGRSSRLVTPALRNLIGLLDGECCRFPGCTRTAKLDAHHVLYWRDGGRTDLANLFMVCERHHTLIHQQGFQLQLQADRTLIVKTKDGRPLEHLPPLPWQPKEDLNEAITLTSQWNGDRLDLHHVAWVLTQHAA